MATHRQIWLSLPLSSKVKFSGASQSLCLYPQVGKSVVGPRTFLTVRIFLWYNCSAVCGPSAGQPFGGAHNDLLQEGLCHTLGDPGLLQSEPLSPWQATADLCLCRRHSDTHRQAWSVSVPSGHFNLLFIIIIGYAMYGLL